MRHVDRAVGHRKVACIGLADFDPRHPFDRGARGGQDARTDVDEHDLGAAPAAEATREVGRAGTHVEHPTTAVGLTGEEAHRRGHAGVDATREAVTAFREARRGADPRAALFEGGS